MTGFFSDGKLEHVKIAAGRWAASDGFLHADLTAADTHHEHLAPSHDSASLLDSQSAFN